MTIKCSFTPEPEPIRTNVPPPSTPPKGVQVQFELLRRLGMVSEFDWSKYANTVAAQDKLVDLINRNYFESVMAKMVHLNPQQLERWQTWLARHFPSLARENSQAMQIRRFLLDAKTASENLWNVMPFYAGQVDEALGKVAASDAIKEAYQTFKSTLQANGVPLDKDTLGRLWVTAVEVAQTDRIARVTNAGENGMRLLQARYDRFVERLASMGITEDGVNILMSAAKQVSNVYDEMAMFAKTAGVNMDEIGYLNRILSFDAEFRLSDDVVNAFKTKDGVATAFKNSRTNYDFIVEDELLLAKALGYDDLSKLTEVLSNEKKLLVELANLPDTTLNTLVDSGVLSKIPTLTEDVFEYLVKRYKLPYKGIEELFVVDPQQAWRAASDQLKAALGSTLPTQAMLRNGIEYGWVVPIERKLAEPNVYKDWVQIPPEVFRQYGIEPQPWMNNVYLHPQVAKIYTGLMEVATDPGQLSTLAAVWQYTNRLFKKQVLGTSGFLGRQVLQLFLSSAISGTNLANLIPSLYDYVRFRKLGLEVFDNTKKVFAGGKYTEREMVVELMKRGVFSLSGDTAPIAGQFQRSISESYSALNPLNIPRAMYYWGSIALGKGGIPYIKDGKLRWRALEYGAGLLERMTDEAVNWIMTSGSFLEDAAKLAHFRSTLKDGTLNAIGQYITNGKRFHFTNIEDAVKHSADYFFDYSDIGLGDRMLARNLFPFWVYMSRNLPAVIHHVFRNPHQYMAYNRLVSIMNEQTRQAGEDAPVGGFTAWTRGFGNIFIRHPNGNPNQWLHIPFASFDPIADASNVVTGMEDALLSAFGFLPGSYDADLAQALPDTKNMTAPFIAGLVQGGYGATKVLYALASGRNPNNGRPLVQDDTQTTSTLLFELEGKYGPMLKYAIETMLPYVGHLNKANPFGVFGVAPKEDGQGNVIREGKSSIFGLVSPEARKDADAFIGDSEDNPLVQIARLIGISVTTVDTLRNMGYTEDQLRGSVQDLKRYQTKLERAIKEQTNPDKKQKLNDKLLTVKALLIELEGSRNKAEQWIKLRGGSTREEQRKNKRQQEQIAKQIEAFYDLFGGKK